MTIRLGKLLLVILNVAALCSGAVGSAVEPTSFGEWSEPRDKVRARLAFAEGPSRRGTRIGVIYLELQNLSMSDTVSIHYRAAESPLRCELRDVDGKPIEQKGVGYSGWIPEPCWLVLPHDSVLRFRVTLSGFGVPPNAGWLIAGGSTDCWSIPPDAAGEYVLSGTLSISAPKDEARPRGVWEGVLKLPSLRIPVTAPLTR